MKRINYLFLLLSSLFLFTQCFNDDEDYSLGKFWISMGLVETENTHGYAYVIALDNGDTLLPASTSFRGFDPDDFERVLANYTLLSQSQDSPNLYHAKINSIRDVLFKDIVTLSEENADSIGDDPLKIIDLWQRGNMLNIDFQYYGNYKTHYINLVIDESFEYDENEAVELYLKHNANNDEPRYLLNGLVTFKLDELYNFGIDSIPYVVKSLNYDEKVQTFTGTLHIPEE